MKEEPKCDKCDSHDWQGYLLCRICRRYYVFGKCRNCDQMRSQKCIIDQGELEYIAPLENSEQEESEGE